MDHAAHLSGDRFLQQASDATNGHVAGLAGFWKLGAGRALTLRASQAGVLRIAHGRVWATFDFASQDIHVRAGDYFLGRGESLSLRAGESLVMESFSAGHAASAYFSWEPATACAEVTEMKEPSGWRAGVMQPLVDLRAAFGLAAGALGRLARGLAMGAAAALEAVLTPVAVVFVTARARPHVTGHDFDTFKDDQRRHPHNYNVLAMSNLV
ncbi:Protein of unknown function [Polaromonas sp. YR568]|uniref:DUF2917 domain-containing protein n=1 Tax=Polaromonas sp. YR568 TaxID=1855301 RepID=UPI0008E44C51|nr:DUF2917 domain-containing protein [Polaromonas sp. YR568]SFV03990.1 Protein of unknown function [Polaromonas sp. YR568]